MVKERSRKQELFAAEYLTDHNATRAYIAAGYSATGAAQSASRLLRNTKVAELISQTQEKRMDQLDISAERVLATLAAIAFHDPRKFFNADSSAKQVTELDDVTAMALAGLEVSELFEDVGDQKHVYGLTKKFKLADRLRALEMLGRHLKMFTDKVEHTDKCVRPIQVDSGLDLSKLTKEELEELYRLCQIMEAEERKPGSAQDSAAKPRTRSLPAF
jgi:phage terminase small subunit